MGSVNLDDILTGSLCVIDANVLLYAEQGKSGQAQRLLRRCSKGELIGVLPQTVWQELTHKLMLTEAIMKGVVSGANPAARLADKPDVVRGLRLYQAKVRSLVDLGLRFERCTLEDLLQAAFELQRRYGLLTNDSVVLAVALRLGADCLVSSDKAFRQITDIDVFAPSDLQV
ncbi:MAG: type II toxin-antitoxin system VapC family toxin [Nitrococcus sp.]|nr:type II toxin-antitoxin system VapC family toxin [Nitrococcus sp.]